MTCDICGKKKATVHLTEIIDEQMTETHLCEECARQKSMQMEQQFGLADLLAGLSDFSKQVKDVEKVKTNCKNCGMTYDEFRKFGRLGCSQCYDSFRDNLMILLKKIHGSNHHLGKAPVRIPKMKSEDKDNLQNLKRELQKAIETENFEAAAKLRDKIYEIEENSKKINNKDAK